MRACRIFRPWIRKTWRWYRRPVARLHTPHLTLLCCFEQPNHLNGLRKRYLKISFHTVKDLLNMRKDLVKIINFNRKKKGLTSAYDGDLGMYVITSWRCLSSANFAVGVTSLVRPSQTNMAQ